MINTPMFFAIIGGMDAIPKMRYKWKVCIASMVAISNSAAAFQYQFTAPVKDDYIIEVEATESVISFHAMLASVNGMLAMFLWKQVIDVIRNRDRCISINYRPYLRWESPPKEIELMESVIPEPSTAVIESEVN